MEMAIFYRTDYGKLHLYYILKRRYPVIKGGKHRFLLSNALKCPGKHQIKMACVFQYYIRTQTVLWCYSKAS